MVVNLTAAMAADATLAATLRRRRRLYAPMTGDLTVGGTLRVALPDLFADRTRLVLLPQTVTLNLSQGSTETYEPNPHAATKTAWYEMAVPYEGAERLRASATSADGTVKVAVYRQTDSALTAGDDPALTALLLVASGDADALWDVNPEVGTYFVQVGLTGGTGSQVTVLVEDATPPEGGTFAYAIDVEQEWGYQPVDTTNAPPESGEPIPAGISPVGGTGWLRWIAPVVPPRQVTFQVAAVDAAGDVALAVRQGTAVNALTTVTQATGLATAGVQVTFAPASGQTYFLQVAAETERQVWDVTWFAATELVEPEALYDYLTVVVYQPDGTTKITELPDRRGVEFNDPLNTVGMGRIEVPLDAPVFEGYPTCLRTGNVVKFFLGPKCVQGFRIRESETVYVSDGEYAGQWRTASGPTLLDLLDDLIVFHDGGVRPDSDDTRAFNWASRPGKTSTDWYDPADWADPVFAMPMTNPPGNWLKPPEKRKRYGYPKKWPDGAGKWMFMTTNPDVNGGWVPPRPSHGYRYLRKNVLITRDNQRVRLFVSADEDVAVYVDGDEVLTREGKEFGYQSYSKVSMRLPRGLHTIGIRYRQVTGAIEGNDAVDAVIFAMFEIRKDGSKGDVIVRSNATWKGWWGQNPPGWNRAQVLRQMVLEARDRGNDTANRLGLGFTGDADSAGRTWRDRFGQDVRVGTSGVDLQAQLSESGEFDVWVDPATLRLQAWKRRGSERSGSVALIPGVNLRDWSAKEIDQIKNVFLVQYDGGFFTIKAHGSANRVGEREGYVELGGISDPRTARSVMRGVIQGVERAMRRAGYPDVVVRREQDRGGSVIGVPGAYPFLDWATGDVIAAPNADGTLTRMRVLDLACKEDEDGRLSFDPVLEEVTA